MKYVNVIVDNRSDNTDTFYTYRTDLDVDIGDKVSVPFARRKKPIAGYIFDIDVESDLNEDKIRDIISVYKESSLNREMIDTAKWMKSRYGVRYIDAVKLFTTEGKRERSVEINNQETIDYKPNLTREQENAVSQINSSILQKKHRVFLLKGVTNSGKTEVYMRAAETALMQNRGVIILVPEIALSSQMARALKARFGEDKVAVFHSKLTGGERLSEWNRIRRGTARIVVGARTAVFAPMDDIGLIVMDEEHESTYKSDHTPKYDTIDIAYKRTRNYSATLVLGSATPSVVSFNRAGVGIYKLIEMNERIGIKGFPKMEIIDMRKELRNGNRGNFSSELARAMHETLEDKRQVILFLNRRGFSTQITCLECGHRFMCNDCGINMTYHKSENAIVCHYCGRKEPVPSRCPKCGSKYLKFIGSGTERVESEAKALFPDYEIDRFDLDTAKNQRQIDRTLSRFLKKKTDILIGTQILAKGLDFKNVGLVGVMMADTTLNIPDYRSSERTFQLITQVSGRAGRGDDGKGLIIIQTYQPESKVIKAAATYDYEQFYKEELLHRKIMYYPPYSDIIAVSFAEKEKDRKNEKMLMAYANDFYERLMASSNAPGNAKLLKPVKVQGRGRTSGDKISFIIKSPVGSRSFYIGAFTEYRQKMLENNAECYIEIDVNPY